MAGFGDFVAAAVVGLGQMAKEASESDYWKHQFLTERQARQLAEQWASESVSQEELNAFFFESPEGVLGILPNAPLEVAEAVYRVQVKLNRPDLGGSNDKTRRLNLAIEEIRQRH